MQLVIATVSVQPLLGQLFESLISPLFRLGSPEFSPVLFGLMKPF